MKIVDKKNLIHAFSPSMKAVLSAKPQEVVVFETLDALGGQIQKESDVVQLDFSKVNPATGPVYVEGAKPGMTLVVKILDIEIDNQGVIVAEEGFGVLQDVAKGFVAKILKIENDFVDFAGKKLLINPMVGVIGVAPENEEFPTGTAHKHGGNMDTKEISKGNILYLPIFQEGALLALGDVHALMADGEVCVSACEVNAKVTVKIDVTAEKIEWPIVETKDSFCIIVSLPTLDEAVKEATHQAVRFLSQKLNMSTLEAYMLASLAVDIRISQLVDPNKTAKAVIPKTLLA
ncbi:acetamidase/formamidase family protein [Pseudothermotoga thermarum]|uniref:Acetamidase/Formamidase n=1 Tax=Pseudothermotoga thermarum DSM 5069 TaxID=688269 RepID=F7YUP8_9THEM|nr:acetamidase/formamidase family protein [Pseudothermotoga thermarum]AEH50233.1 Acetamidase/Formamidase [Pseudothermotoga thermarum DSM 5069]